MNIIEVHNLTHDFISYDEENDTKEVIRAIDDVSLNIEEGQFVAILGHNGSGKSTLAKHFNAILLPTLGDVYVDNINTKDEDKLWDIRKTAGMVFQNPDNQIIGTVVEEDVAFGPENIGLKTEEIISRVDYALEAVGMTKYRNHSPNKLSGGQKQRVAIAGIVAMKPKCIILDEPTAMLDPKGRKEVLKTIQELNKKEKVTVILITHYMNEVIDADKVFVMDNAKIVLEGTPKEIFSDVKRLKDYGLDVPQVTELAYRLKKDGYNIPDSIITIREFVEAYKSLFY